MDIEKEVGELRRWFASPRFAGIRRVHSAREVVEQRGTIRPDYAVARGAAEAFYARLRQLFEQGKCITTFGPYSPGQAVAMKRMGIEGIYLGGWATSAKGSAHEDPGPDLASYPLSQVPDEAAPIVRALLTADKNQRHARARMTEEQRRSSPEVDFRPFIIADADTGHGGDAHVRNLIRRFVEVGVPGYHIEDQKPGVKKCGHQGGKVLVSEDEQLKRLSAARFQLDIMGVPGIIVARTDAESATLLDGRSDDRDQPFILGATNVSLPTFKAAFLAILRRFQRAGVEELSGHELYALCDEEYAAADAWLERGRLRPGDRRRRRRPREGRRSPAWTPRSTRSSTRSSTPGSTRRASRTYAEAVGDVIGFRENEGDHPAMTQGGVARVRRAGARSTRRGEKARSIGVDVTWDCEHAKTPDGYYQVRGGIDYAIAKSLAAAPFADLLWMETKTADLHDAKRFADAIHAAFPDKMLAYNLSPSFNWDTTGMNDEQMRRFPEELGKLGFVFNFITYGGHQIDGLAVGGVRDRAPPGRHARAGAAAAEVPPARVALPHAADAGRRAARRRRAHGDLRPHVDDQGDGPGLDAVPAPRADRGAAEAARGVARRSGASTTASRASSGSRCGRTPPSPTCSSWRSSRPTGRRSSNVIFASIHDRRGRSILSVRDQNNFDSRPAQEAADDAGPALPLPPLQGGLGALRHADRGQPAPGRGDEGAAASSARSCRRSARSSSPT